MAMGSSSLPTAIFAPLSPPPSPLKGRGNAPDMGVRAVTLSVPLAREVDFGMRDHLLYELARDLSSSLELEVVLRKVMDRVITLMQASRGPSPCAGPLLAPETT